MENFSVLAPPLAFVIMLAAVFVLSLVMSRLSIDRKGKRHTGPYACGENLPEQRHMVQPDYGQFLPFAVFFTILHVIVLMVTTIPAAAVVSAFALAAAYIVSALVGLYVLYAR